ncbi:ephrin [Carabus blaptoides fortunei]
MLRSILNFVNCRLRSCNQSANGLDEKLLSLFRIDNTDHIIDVNKGNLKFEYDQVNIICPVYMPGTYDEDAEKYIIYNVSKEEYETCRITNPNPRIIAVCDKPYKLMYFTITFRPFTPQPGGLEFLPGKDYYFISTSSKDDLHRRVGGRCSANNMKIVFKVCCAPDESHETNNNGAPQGSGGVNPPTSTSVSWPVRPTMGPGPAFSPGLISTTHIISTGKPVPDVAATHKTIKKTEVYDPSENEITKGEHERYNSGVRQIGHGAEIMVLLLSIFFSSLCTRWR